MAATDAVPLVPTDPAAVAPAPVGAIEPVAGAPIDDADGGVVAGCVVDGVADAATLPGCMADGTIVGLIIVMGAEPAPPPTHPDIVIVPVLDVPGVCGVIGVARCATIVADASANMRPGTDSFIYMRNA